MRMTRLRRRSGSRADQIWRLAATLAILSGTYLILAALAGSTVDAWRQRRLLSQLEQGSPTIQAPPGAPAPAAASVAQAHPPQPGPADPVVAGAPQAASAAVVRAERAEGAPAYRLEFPTLGRHYAVLVGIDEPVLAQAPGHYPDTPFPGEMGNAAVAGHRTLRSRPSFFYELDRLQPGDPIHVAYPDQVLIFAVERVFVTGPHALSVLEPTPEPWLTLTTCDPPGTNTNRLVVQARLVGVEPTGTAVP